MKYFVLLVIAGCAGDPFTLADAPDSGGGILYVIPQEQEATTPTQATYDVRDLPDAGGGYSDSGGDTAVGIDARMVDSAVTWIAETSRDAQQAPEVAQGCPPPVAGGYSNVCATAPTRGETIISTFPGECACNWTCACLMASSICGGIGKPQSCTIVDGPVCNSVVVAVVTCQ